jgi:ribose 5-phosphate isomerase B
MKIAIGTDHAGYLYKEKIKDYLIESGHQVTDFGAHSQEAVDYPVFIRPVAQAVAKGEADRGIVLGGSGNGEAMVANRVRGVRCALCWNVESASLARRHNDSNVLSLGARMMAPEEALEIVRTWLETPFDEGRHVRRIAMIDNPASMTVSPSRDAGAAAGQDGRAPEIRSASRDDFDVTISFGYILYWEGKDSVEFKVDPGLKHPSVINIPSDTRWKEEMPEWCRDRREEIVERLKRKCIHLNGEWMEY